MIAVFGFRKCAYGKLPVKTCGKESNKLHELYVLQKG
jgi:hypothetical protein